MDAKFGFCIKFYAKVQIFRVLESTELFLWPFKNHQIFQELYGLYMNYMKTDLGEKVSPSSFLYGEAI